MTWDASDGLYRAYSHWPDPFRNSVKDIKQLACNHTWQAKVKMYGLGVGKWAWTAFIPQPTEIVRKTLTGSYKCGFYLDVKFKSPVDVIWADQGIGDALLEIAHPAVTGLFYLWAAGSLFDAVNTWSSIMYAQMMCDLDRDECLLASGVASFYGDGGTGPPTDYHELYDPNHWHESFGGSISVLTPANVSVFACGYITTTINNVTSCKVMIVGPHHSETNPYAVIDMGAVPNRSTIPWSLDIEDFMDRGEIAIIAQVEMAAPALAHCDLFVTRFTVVEKQNPPDRTCLGRAGQKMISA